MVGDDQHAFIGHGLSDDGDANAEQLGHEAVIAPRERAHRPATQPNVQHLIRHQDERSGQEDDEDAPGAQRLHQRGFLLPFGTPYRSRRWSISSKPSSSATRRGSFSMSSLRNSITLP